MIHFKCPCCEREHSRGFFNAAIGVFRCLHCGYVGHGFHPDPEIDKAVFAEFEANNRLNRSLDVPEVPYGVDPLNGAGL